MKLIQVKNKVARNNGFKNWKQAIDTMMFYYSSGSVTQKEINKINDQVSELYLLSNK